MTNIIPNYEILHTRRVIKSGGGGGGGSAEASVVYHWFIDSSEILRVYKLDYTAGTYTEQYNQNISATLNGIGAIAVDEVNGHFFVAEASNEGSIWSWNGSSFDLAQQTLNISNNSTSYYADIGVTGDGTGYWIQTGVGNYGHGLSYGQYDASSFLNTQTWNEWGSDNTIGNFMIRGDTEDATFGYGKTYVVTTPAATGQTMQIWSATTAPPAAITSFGISNQTKFCLGNHGDRFVFHDGPNSRNVTTRTYDPATGGITATWTWTLNADTSWYPARQSANPYVRNKYLVTNGMAPQTGQGYRYIQVLEDPGSATEGSITQARIDMNTYGISSISGLGADPYSYWVMIAGAGTYNRGFAYIEADGTIDTGKFFFANAGTGPAFVDRNYYKVTNAIPAGM